MLRKELLDAVRDRRTLLAVFVPIGLVALAGLAGPSLLPSIDMPDSPRETTQVESVMGADHGRSLVDGLESQPGMRVEEDLEGGVEAAEAVRAGTRNLVLILPEGSSDRLSELRTADLQVFIDKSDWAAKRAAILLRARIREYVQDLVERRLVDWGVEAELIQPIRIETVEVEVPEISVADGRVPAEMLSPATFLLFLF